MKITIYELLGMVRDGKIPKKIKYHNYICYYDDGDYKIESKNEWLFAYEYINLDNLNDEVEIIEENKKELHANNIEFNINNDKRDCIITLDENDLGIDKLHLDNCYFYKENDKWYVKHINLNPVAYISQEHKIPGKINDILRFDGLIPPVDENMYKIWEQTIKNHNKINEILDYLEKME